MVISLVKNPSPPMNEKECWYFETYRKMEEFIRTSYPRLADSSELCQQLKWARMHQDKTDWNLGCGDDLSSLAWWAGYNNSLVRTAGFKFIDRPRAKIKRKEKRMLSSIKDTAVSLRETIKPYEKYIIAALALYVLDVLVLKGKGKESLERIAHKVSSKLERFLDKE